ncbi:MaoC/PaaZ C-terminal domain-containing protein [Chondromyces crocatus]|uniref:3-alpha,7-alpha, 12-alpha-trihydroxy-5-beta-cholest-24-enoyl-CoA hydratase n=1 Tax=Chondromyces crocatus TaxID=52 RepID=A0A0K1EFM5_CHOCO|nr:MaoC/PaaZ C-terminal domain-containing protein [Chondromyces crocatus]AKT39388.1 3-alpha,7-alpha, 12-alpha-trihydroxy-5-beta-cholest-24-enoyl-CoA hydratase [Chondromyces crocatus]
MPLDPSTVGYTTQPNSFTYDWKTVALYALGIGARRDELPYLYEGTPGGLAVYPTFAVIPAYQAVLGMLTHSGGDMAMVVHGGQKVRLHRPIPASGTLSTVGTLQAMYDLKKFAQVILETRTTLDGEPLFDTTWSIIFRGAGGFGVRRPATEEQEPSVPKDRAPDWTEEEATSPEQALLYRLSGDLNPLHADPAFAASVGFEQGPILHGLCTYGFAARAVVRHAARGDASRLRTFAAQFRKPVWPGDVIVTQGWHLDDGKIAVLASVKGRPDPVLTGAWAEIG